MVTEDRKPEREGGREVGLQAILSGSTGGTAMRMNQTILLATTASLALSGCKTSLQSVPDLTRTTNRDSAIVGATYSLPMLTFDITVTRSLSGCGNKIQLPPANAKDKDETGVVLPVWVGGPTISIAGEAEPEMIPGQRFRYNPAKLKSVAKTTNFQMTYHKGSDLLKGINSTTDDQTGAIIGDLVKVGLAVASVAAGPATAGAGLAMLGAATTETLIDQNDKFPKIIDNQLQTNSNKYADLTESLNKNKKFSERIILIGRLLKIIQSSSSESEVSSETVSVVCTSEAETTILSLSNAVKAKQAQADIVAATTPEIESLLTIARIRPLIQADRDRLSAKVFIVEAALREADKQQRIIDEAKKTLSVGSETRWPKTHLDGDLVALDDLKADGSSFKALLTVEPRRILDPARFAEALARDENADLRRAFPKWVATYLWPDGTSRYAKPKASSEISACSIKADVPDAAKMVTVDLCLALLLPVAVELTPEAQEEGITKVELAQPVPSAAKPGKGLFYRMPVRGSLGLCRISAGAATLKCRDQGSIIKESVLIPQLGQLRFLPLRSREFESQGLIANFDENGGLTDVNFVTSKAAGAAFAATAAAVAKDVKDFDDTRRKERKEDEDLKEKKAKADAAEAKADKEEADTATRTANTNLAKDARAEADLAEARLAKITAERCLAIADASTNVPTKCPAE